MSPAARIHAHRRYVHAPARHVGTRLKPPRDVGHLFTRRLLEVRLATAVSGLRRHATLLVRRKARQHALDSFEVSKAHRARRVQRSTCGHRADAAKANLHHAAHPRRATFRWLRGPHTSGRGKLLRLERVRHRRQSLSTTLLRARQR